MKNLLTTAGLLAAIALIPLTALAEDQDKDRAHPLTFVKDSAITTKIKAKLADEKMGSLVHVSVDTDNKGSVVLSGNVKSQMEADKYGAIARETEGVTSVTNNLKIKPAE